MLSSLIVAHAGHWATGLVYLAPVVIVVIALAIQSRKDGGRDADAQEEEDPDI